MSDTITNQQYALVKNIELTSEKEGVIRPKFSPYFTYVTFFEFTK